MCHFANKALSSLAQRRPRTLSRLHCVLMLYTGGVVVAVVALLCWLWEDDAAGGLHQGQRLHDVVTRHAHLLQYTGARPLVSS